MAKILVTGGAGYVGSVCCAELVEQGHEVTVVDDLSTGHREAVHPGARFARLDIGDQAGTAELVRQGKVEVVFHFAAKAEVGESMRHPGKYYEENVAKGIAFLEVLRAAGIRKFIFSSSAAVYGDPVEVPIPEGHPASPVNPYGETKLVFEKALSWYAKAYGWSAVCFRYFNAAGATARLGEQHDPETHIIPLLLQVAAGERESFDIFGEDYPTADGTCLRDYVHVTDIALAHICALPALSGAGFRVYNIGLGRSHSVREVCRAAEKACGRKIATHLVQRRPGDPAVLCADPRTLMKELAWTPCFHDLEKIIASAWEWKQKRSIQR